MEPVLLVHGGAGEVTRERLGAEREALARHSLAEALQTGQGALLRGGGALDAVEAAVRVLEDEPFWNAGRGSVLTSTGQVEMDASVMDGRDRSAGAVAAVRTLAHPISAARRVLEETEHVLLVGDGAEALASAHGLLRIAPEALVTEPRRRQLERARARLQIVRDHDEGLGTVGAVALDERGHLAAGTSTGGMTNQLPGRVGDSPVVGAGTWADDAVCAVSGTGHGEAFLRSAFAHEVDAALRLGRAQSVEAACRAALERVSALGSTGGAIALDPSGRSAFAFTTAAMYRGEIRGRGEARVAIFTDD